MHEIFCKERLVKQREKLCIIRALCHADKKQNYIRLTTKPIVPSPRKNTEGQTQSSQNTFIQKNVLHKQVALCTANTEDSIVFKCQRIRIFLQNPSLSL
jgi:hypothetical protein